MSVQTLAMPASAPRPAARDYAVLAVLCAVCAAVNVTKAVHMDDTAYLAIVDAILRDPVHVMSAVFNWHNTAEPIAEINQPHLFFYVQALVALVFGRSELVQHLLVAGVASVAVVLFHRLAVLVAARRPLLLTALFALGPAFLPGQNLMVDVPLIALWLLAFVGIFSSKPSGTARYGVAAFAIAAACLVKYTSLVLIVVLAVTIIRRRHWPALAWLAVPVAALTGWSILNLVDYGRIHIVGRRVNPMRVAPAARRALDVIVGIGAVAPFTLAWWPWLAARRAGRLVVLAAVVAAAAMFMALRMYRPMQEGAAWWAVFLANGVLTLGLVGLCTVRSVRPSTSSGRTDISLYGRRAGDGRTTDQQITLWWWLAGVLLFLAALSPFMAVRHVLLAMPPVILFVGGAEALPFGPRRAAAALALTALLGVGLAVSDWMYAEVYREAVPRVRASVPAGARVWSVGHWGWQWYATRAGLGLYDVKTTVMETGDYVVIPSITDRQIVRLTDRWVMQKVGELGAPAGPLSWLRTMSLKPYGGYYYFSLEDGSGPPWLVSTQPLETFAIYRVVR